MRAFSDALRRCKNDRRGELSKFKTVQHALADRERIEKSKTAKAKAKTKKR